MTTSTSEPARLLSSQICEHLGAEAPWAAALDQVADNTAGLHLAVLTEPFLGWLLDGSKTIESRFSRVRCAPYGALCEGDIVAIKKPGGLVSGAFLAGPVSCYRLTPARITEIRNQFAAQIRADDDEFWDHRADCAYATLIQVRHVRRLPGLPFPKKDRRGWAPLTCARTQLAFL
jgi:hypothetical protein